MIDAYRRRRTDRSLTPTTSLVTGYDFLADAATQRQDDARVENRRRGGNHETLITNRACRRGRSGRRRREAGRRRTSAASSCTERNDIVFLAGHFSANDALAADYKTNVLTTELGPVPANLLAKTIVFSAGCHAGYNIVNEHAVHRVDAAARLGAGVRPEEGHAHRRARATSTATRTSSHTASGSTRSSRDSSADRWGARCCARSRSSSRQSPGLSALDEKALLADDAVRPADAEREPRRTRHCRAGLPSMPTRVGGVPGAAFGLRGRDQLRRLDRDPAISSRRPLNGLGSPATWFEGTGGRVAVKPMQPVLPLSSANVTAASRSLRGVLFTERRRTRTRPGRCR